MPVPDKGTDCGLPPALLLINSDAARAPVAVGVNVTLMVQLADGPSVLPQVEVFEKSPAFVPRIAICHRLTVAAPVFVRVASFGALLVLTLWLAKVRLAGVGFNAAPTPVNKSV